MSLIFGIPLGVYQAVHRYTLGDYALTGLSFLGYATPTFFVGLLLVEWFAVDIHLFPPFAPQGNSVGAVLSQPRALVLPVIAYAFVLYALWSRFMRSSTMDNLVQDYVPHRPGQGRERSAGALGSRLPQLAAHDRDPPQGSRCRRSSPGRSLSRSSSTTRAWDSRFYQAALNVDYATLLGFTLIATVATIAGTCWPTSATPCSTPRVRYG